MGALRYSIPRNAGLGHWLVAVDLGKTKLGVAIFYVPPDGGQPRLIHSTTVIADDPEPGAVASSVRAHVSGVVGNERPVVWVCEWPQKYPDAPKYHANLDELYAVGDALGVTWAKKYAPRTWKGNVPKDVHHRRLRSRLTSTESTRMPAMSEHDAWDATGIGLYATGRTGRGGT